MPRQSTAPWMFREPLLELTNLLQQARWGVAEPVDGIHFEAMNHGVLMKFYQQIGSNVFRGWIVVLCDVRVSF